ncbi:MAG: hypothetical protein CL928_16175 [Deltaproteobacteria bacterium]|nr:hypothetical protein [Deltaproteobacteria bacterium]
MTEGGQPPLPTKGSAGADDKARAGLTQFLDNLFRPLDQLGRVWTVVWQGFKDFLRQIMLLRVIFLLILLVSGIYHYVAKTLGVLDRALDRLETTIIFVATLGMTGLVFLDFVNRESDSFSLEIADPVKLSLLMMLWVAFLGSSLATRDGKHLAIDAADRALSPKGSRLLYRISMLLATIFSWQLFKASVAVVKKHFFNESLAKVTVPETVTRWLNSFFSWLLDGWVKPEHFEDPEYYKWMMEEGIAVTIARNGLKLWVAELVLPVAFLLMALRFAGLFFGGRKTDIDLDDIPARHMRKNPGDAGGRDMVLAGLLPGLLVGLLLGLWFSQMWLIVVCTFLLMLAGTPLFVVIGTGAALCVYLLEGDDLTLVVRDLYTASDKEVLLAIPFFVMAGAIMTEGSIAQRLIDMAKSVVGWFPGGLAISGVLSCMVFAAISGSSPVTVIAIGSIMVPALINAKYDERFSLGLLTSAGSLGILIPPSIPMIIYAVVCFSDLSVVSEATGSAPTVRDLFIAGILPGFLIGFVLIGWSVFKERDKMLPVSETLGSLPGTFTRGIWAAGLPLLIIGGIYSGLFTATEAAAISVVYALVVEFAIHPTLRWFGRRQGRGLDEPLFELSPRELPRVFRDSAVIMGSLMLIIVLAIAFNKFLISADVPAQAAAWVKAHVDSRVQFLILVNIFLLLLGCMMDIMSAILIVAPLLAPIAMKYGIDPIHFAIIVIVNLEIGYLTPPLGLNLFVASSVFDRSILQVIRSVIPFTLLMLFSLALISWFPWFSLALVEVPPEVIATPPIPLEAPP